MGLKELIQYTRALSVCLHPQPSYHSMLCTVSLNFQTISQFFFQSMKSMQSVPWNVIQNVEYLQRNRHHEAYRDPLSSLYGYTYGCSSWLILLQFQSQPSLQWILFKYKPVLCAVRYFRAPIIISSSHMGYGTRTAWINTLGLIYYSLISIIYEYAL
jgi:hypothetical protein